MAYTMSLLVFVINRTRAIRQHISTASKYKKIDGKTGRVKLLLTTIWCLGILLPAPILVGVIEAWPFPARYSCHIAHDLAPLYGVVTSSFPYVTTWLVYLFCSLLIYSAIKTEKKREEIDKRGQLNVANKLATNTAIFMAHNQMWHDMKHVFLMIALLLLYFVLLAPYIVFTKTNTIYQYWEPYELELYRNLSTTYYEDPSEDDSITPLSLARSFNDIETNTNLTLHDPGYWEIPEIKEGSTDAETVVVWMRFIHFCLVPIVVFILNKDIRHKAGDLLICCGSSRSTITPRPISALLHRQNLELHRKQEQKKFKLCDYHVPVLFATQEGLYLRVLDNEVATPSKDNHDPQEVNKDNLWTIEPQFITELCDLKIESQSFVTHFSEEEDRKRSEDNTTIENHSEDEHHHHHHHHHHGKEKKKVQFRNTVVDIDEQLSEDVGGFDHQGEYKDFHERKMTGIGGRHSAKSHKKHRRASFNPDGHFHEGDHHKRRSSN